MHKHRQGLYGSHRVFMDRVDINHNAEVDHKGCKVTAIRAKSYAGG